jgi:hypothetical protein
LADVAAVGDQRAALAHALDRARDAAAIAASHSAGRQLGSNTTVAPAARAPPGELGDEHARALGERHRHAREVDELDALERVRDVGQRKLGGRRAAAAVRHAAAPTLATLQPTPRSDGADRGRRARARPRSRAHAGSARPAARPRSARPNATGTPSRASVIAKLDSAPAKRSRSSDSSSSYVLERRFAVSRFVLPAPPTVMEPRCISFPST